MASIQKRTTADGAVSYRVQVRLKGHPPQTETFPRLTDARRWAAQTEAAIREGRAFPTKAARETTLAEAIGRYRVEILPGKRNADQTDRHLNWWASQIGSYALASVTAPIIIECRGRLKAAGKGPATQNRYLAALSHLFTVAHREWQLVPGNPVRLVTRAKEPRGRVRFLDADERARLLAACKASSHPALYPAVLLAISTGMRKGEILGLAWRDVDLSAGAIVLHDTKNGERRRVPLVALAADVMRQYAKVRQLGGALVFPSIRSPGRPADIKDAWEAARQAADLDDFHFHDLRHTCASYLAMNGATLAEIAEVLGHKTLAMVKRYAHLSDSHVSGVVERMNRAMLS